MRPDFKNLEKCGHKTRLEFHIKGIRRKPARNKSMFRHIESNLLPISPFDNSSAGTGSYPTRWSFTAPDVSAAALDDTGICRIFYSRRIKLPLCGKTRPEARRTFCSF